MYNMIHINKYKEKHWNQKNTSDLRCNTVRKLYTQKNIGKPSNKWKTTGNLSHKNNGKSNKTIFVISMCKVLSSWTFICFWSTSLFFSYISNIMQNFDSQYVFSIFYIKLRIVIAIFVWNLSRIKLIRFLISTLPSRLQLYVPN